jgi:hypothetical protein
MKSRYIAIVLLIVISHILSEAHTFIMWAYPTSITYYVDDWFLQPGFKVERLSILWYSKMIEDSLIPVALFFAGACQAHSHNYKTYLEWKRYSNRLYIIWLIYFAYHCFDMLSFMYNYKTSYLSYVVFLSICTVSATFVGFYKIKIFNNDNY